MEPWARVVAIGRSQGGPVAVRQAVAVGLSRSSFDDRVRRERWARPFPGVAVLPGRPLSADVMARAAALCIGEHAVVTGVSALALHGVCDMTPPTTQLVVPEGRRARRLERVRVVRSRTLRPDDHGSWHGVRLATVQRALLDAAARTGRETLRTWLIDGRQRRLLEVVAVAGRAVSATSVPGRGRLLLACADVDRSAADSMLVAEVETRLRQAGFRLDVPARTVAVPGRMLHPDLTLRGLSIGIEVDGFGTHSTRHALDLDQRKHNAYALVGWVVLRIGWTRMSADWNGFVAELRSAISQQGSSAMRAP